MLKLVPLALGALLAPIAALAQDVKAEEVQFPSRDGSTSVKAYLFKPADANDPLPAAVLMSGSGGVYSSEGDGMYNASRLAKRYKHWGTMLAKNGFVVLLIDEYSALGYPGGVANVDPKDRPAQVDEISARPLHSYGALRFLQARPDIVGNRVVLVGWANGGTSVLAALADDKPGDMKKIGFAGGIAFSPSCRLRKRFDKSGYKPYQAVRVYMASTDQEALTEACQSLATRTKAAGGEIEVRPLETEADIVGFLKSRLND